MDLGFDLKDWEEVEAVEMGDYERLELGGHEVVILDARLHKNELTGTKSLKVCVDIAGNDKQAGYFKRQYDNNKLSEAKWPNGGTKYMSLNKESLKFVKGLVETILPNSNNGFVFDKNKGWEQLKGLKCAAEFGMEEYDNNGKITAPVKLLKFRSLDKLSEIKIPQVKLLNGEMVDYEEYKKKHSNQSTSSRTLSDEELNKFIDSAGLDL